MSILRNRRPTAGALIIAASALLAVGAGRGDADVEETRVRGAARVQANQPLSEPALPAQEVDTPTSPEASKSSISGLVPSADVLRSAQTVALFGLVSLAPAALLMVTAFVRINIVLVLLRQAMGSPQVPGNQVLTALALLLTALVMRPVADSVYTKSIEPYRKGEINAVEAWKAGSTPIKEFMVRQIQLTNNQQYLWTIYDLTVRRESPDAPEPRYVLECPLRVVAPAYLLSEIKTGLLIGFFIYLPFLVIDLVVSAVLAAMGLFMLPPSLVALPLKLILFVLAEGWLSVATMLLQSFGAPG
jgi:flagellar biosynthetic protein FliP